jgi:rfaE bifunctional protein kinase chain/domain
MLSSPSEYLALESVLQSLPAGRVTVFGDFCLEANGWFGPDANERSTETGLAVQRVERQVLRLGGAANVAANLASLRTGEIRAIGVVGQDTFGRELIKLLQAQDVDISGMLVTDEWQTMVYAKRYEGEQERLDFGASSKIDPSVADFLLEALDRAARISRVVILNEQMQEGVTAPKVILRINELIEMHPQTRFIVDSRHNASLYRNVIYKLNAREAAQFVGECPEMVVIPLQLVRVYAQRLCQQTQQPVFVTRGDRGIVLADASGVHEIPGIEILERTDPVGAGDTVVAALAAVLAVGGNPLVAAHFANIAASITVRKLHTSQTATPDEIRVLGKTPDYIFSPELAEDSSQAQYLGDAEIELIRSIPENIQIQHAIFDHDGTLSTVREGWETIMEPMMIEAILGSPRFQVERAVYDRVQKTVREFIDKTTGVQTLAQMHGLTAMVKEFGFVRKEEILDEHGYKARYNDALLRLVRSRLEKLERRELAPEDFQIKNASSLLRALCKRGVRLYLVSGTDEADVRKEAEAMGYADLFEGRIFGSVGDLKVEAKKVVVERILREHCLRNGELVTFGDGPIEIRETYKSGGICVGVASDELTRFGLNLDKRARLVRAGAHLIVPDFNHLNALLSVLHLN